MLTYIKKGKKSNQNYRKTVANVIKKFTNIKINLLKYPIETLLKQHNGWQHSAALKKGSPILSHVETNYLSRRPLEWLVKDPLRLYWAVSAISVMQNDISGSRHHLGFVKKTSIPTWT